jgi:hypothetical protein
MNRSTLRFEMKALRSASMSFKSSICPYLPLVSQVLTAEHLSDLKDHRGEQFYAAALRYAHSLWLQGLPARTLLVLDRALGADLKGNEPELKSWPLPYAAVSWVITHAQPGQYLSNPRIHYQHLATRVRGPRAELRRWRAWACWSIARKQLPHLSPDHKQQIQEPTNQEIADHLKKFGLPKEEQLWWNSLKPSSNSISQSCQPQPSSQM